MSGKLVGLGISLLTSLPGRLRSYSRRGVRGEPGSMGVCAELTPRS